MVSGGIFVFWMGLGYVLWYVLVELRPTPNGVEFFGRVRISHLVGAKNGRDLKIGSGFLEERCENRTPQKSRFRTL